MVVNLVTKNNLEYLLEIIYPSKNILQDFVSVDEKLNFIIKLKQEESKVIQKFLRLSNGDTLLDFGVGIGLITEQLHKFVAQTYCYDTDKEMLEHCKNKFNTFKNIEVITEYEHIQPNKITVNHVFAEHFIFEQFTDCMQKLYNILQPNGLIWIDFFNEEQKNDSNKHLNKNFYGLNKTLDKIKKIGYKHKLIDSRNVHVKMLLEKL